MGADEDTFADVLNGFSLGSRPRRRSEPVAEPPAAEEPAERQAAAEDYEDNASIVRAYAWTGGRTMPDYRLQIETLIATSAHGLDEFTGLSVEHQEVLELCTESRSVAEVGAVLQLPFGVVRVLLGDMAQLGLVTVYENDADPDIELMERVLQGLTKLGA